MTLNKIKQLTDEKEKIQNKIMLIIKDQPSNSQGIQKYLFRLTYIKGRLFELHSQQTPQTHSYWEKEKGKKRVSEKVVASRIGESKLPDADTFNLSDKIINGEPHKAIYVEYVQEFITRLIKAGTPTEGCRCCENWIKKIKNLAGDKFA